MKIHLKTKAIDEWVVISKVTYFNGRTALIAESAKTGELIAKLTSNIPSEGIAEDEVAVKDYGENEGVLIALIQEGIVAMPNRRIVSQYVTFPVCKVLI